MKVFYNKLLELGYEGCSLSSISWMWSFKECRPPLVHLANTLSSLNVISAEELEAFNQLEGQGLVIDDVRVLNEAGIRHSIMFSISSARKVNPTAQSSASLREEVASLRKQLAQESSLLNKAKRHLAALQKQKQHLDAVSLSSLGNPKDTAKESVALLEDAIASLLQQSNELISGYSQDVAGAFWTHCDLSFYLTNEQHCLNTLSAGLTNPSSSLDERKEQERELRRLHEAFVLSWMELLKAQLGRRNIETKEIGDDPRVRSLEAKLDRHLTQVLPSLYEEVAATEISKIQLEDIKSKVIRQQKHLAMIKVAQEHCDALCDRVETIRNCLVEESVRMQDIMSVLSAVVAEMKRFQRDKTSYHEFLEQQAREPAIIHHTPLPSISEVSLSVEFSRISRMDEHVGEFSDDPWIERMVTSMQTLQGDTESDNVVVAAERAAKLIASFSQHHVLQETQVDNLVAKIELDVLKMRRLTQPITFPKVDSLFEELDRRAKQVTGELEAILNTRQTVLSSIKQLDKEVGLLERNSFALFWLHPKTLENALTILKDRAGACETLASEK